MKIKGLFAAVPALVLILSGCGQGGQKSRDVVHAGRSGNEVIIPAGVNRLISTAPSNTEIIIDLGMADKLIAIDIYSTALTGITGKPLAMDFMYPDAEVLLGLNPDLIIASGINQTSSGDDPFRLIREAGIPVVYIPTSTRIGDIYEDIRFIAEILGAAERGEELAGRMRDEIGVIAKTGAGVVEKKSVYFEISPFPFMVSCGEGTYLNEMIALIGAKNIFAGEKGWFSPAGEAVIDRNPDVILTMAHNPNDPSDNTISEIKVRAGFETIRAIQNNEVYYIDADSVSRPSPRILLALRQMARAVYPDLYEEKN
jgi:iron complex transport system substrate-binding protein